MIATMIGLGVGLDYALFVVTRHRELLHEGHSVHDAAAKANATAGQAVLFAGVTVVIAICGLQVSGIPAVADHGLLRRPSSWPSACCSPSRSCPALLGLAGHEDRQAAPAPVRRRSLGQEAGGTRTGDSRVGPLGRTTSPSAPGATRSARSPCSCVLAAPVTQLRVGVPRRQQRRPESTRASVLRPPHRGLRGRLQQLGGDRRRPDRQRRRRGGPRRRSRTPWPPTRAWSRSAAPAVNASRRHRRHLGHADEAPQDEEHRPHGRSPPGHRSPPRSRDRAPTAYVTGDAAAMNDVSNKLMQPPAAGSSGRSC